MKNLDKHLIRIQEDQLNEIEPITMIVGGLALQSVYLISSLAFFLWSAAQMERSLKVDKGLSERLNLILGTKNYWKVHIFPDPDPGAFSLGKGKHVFITSGLLKILNKREIEAILLHEIQHNKSKDTYKDFMYKHSFFYLVTYLAATTTAVSFPLGILAFAMLIKIPSILLGRVVGRPQEIRADRFAVKYGYHKELISALQKVDAYINKHYTLRSCTTKWCELERKVSDIMDEHPATKKRVEIILKSADKIKTSNFSKTKNFIARVFKQNG